MITRKRIIIGSLVAIIAIGLNIALLVLPIPYQEIGEYGYGGVFLSSVLSSAAKGLPIPLPAILLIAAHFLNPFVVGLIYGAGSTLGEITGYGLGAGSRVLLTRHAAFPKVRGWMERHGSIALFIAAAIPNPFFTVAGTAAGAAQMSLWRFFISIGCGRILRGIIMAVLFLNIPLLNHHL